MQIKKLTGSPVPGFKTFTDAGGGGTLTSPLILVGAPTLPLQATNKDYIDSALNAIPMSKVVSGTMLPARFPAFAGEVVKAAGDAVINLSPTGVGAGTYTKFSVDAGGRITTAALLAAGDIPNISWTKIVGGKPTTLTGYEITDGLNKAGGTLTNFLFPGTGPVSGLQIATKNYVDSFALASKYLVGDVMIRGSSVTPSGFLRANGGSLNKTTYSALYAVIGDTYNTSALQLGCGHPWQQQYGSNSTQSGNITGWTTGTSLPLALSQTQIVVTKSKVYLVGGYYNSGTGRTEIYSAPINASGVVGTWSLEASSFPVAIHSQQIVVTKNRAYSLGGSIAGTVSSAIYTATIDSAGVMSAWTLSGSVMPGATMNHVAFSTANKIYVIGGNSTNKVYSCAINSDGTLGSWTTETNFPTTTYWGQYAITKNRIYLFAYNSTAIYTAPIDSSGTIGTWVLSGLTLPAQLSASQVTVTNNTVYIYGGVIAMSSFSSAVYYSAINADGTLAGFVAGTSMPGAIGFSQALVTSTRIYIIGHQGAATVYYATYSGGLNDYSPYYNGTIVPADPTMFKLPDYSAKETATLFYFVKY